MRPRREPPCTRPLGVGVPVSVRQGRRKRPPPLSPTSCTEGPIGSTTVWGTSRSVRLAIVLVAVGGLLGAACSGGDTGAATPVLGWYINPDNGGQAELAAACSATSGGRYRITVSTLPNDASG